MANAKWTGDDLWNLLNLPNETLYQIYPHDKKNKLRTLKVYYLKKGTTVERSVPYENPDIEREKASRRRRVASPMGSAALSPTTSLDFPSAHLRYHQELEAALLEHGTVSKATFTDWEMGYKDSDGEAQTIPLKGSRFEIKFDHEPQWPVVTRVESVTLPKKESKKAPGGSRTAVILPDLQIPFHDEEAVSIALQIVRDTKPDKIVLLGDALDLSAWGKYTQMPEYATATQGAIVELHKLLATLRKMAPTAEIAVLAGNHEARMANHLLNNARAAYGLKRADDMEGWPVMSVPYLCAFDQLDVEYIDGYPAARYWINERLQVRHGHIVRSGGSTAKAVADDERVSTIFGHVHRIETQYKTVNVYGGARTNFAHTPGCLCRIDGHVPSMKGGINQKTGQPVKNFENWQSGLAVVTYQDGDAPFNLEQIYINSTGDYETMYRGKVYGPTTH